MKVTGPMPDTRKSPNVSSHSCDLARCWVWMGFWVSLTVALWPPQV